MLELKRLNFQLQNSAPIHSDRHRGLRGWGGGSGVAGPLIPIGPIDPYWIHFVHFVLPSVGMVHFKGPVWGSVQVLTALGVAAPSEISERSRCGESLL